MSHWEHAFRLAVLLLIAGVANSCNGASVEYGYDLSQPLNFVMTDALHEALDEEGRRIFTSAAEHAADALGVQAGWGRDKAHAGPELPSENPTVRLTLGTVDCTGDRAGYVRWRPNNVLQICPSMVHERNYLLALSLVMHELGHVVGANHVGCDGESIMAPDLSCPKGRYDRATDHPDALFWYSDTDVAEICQHTEGGICGK